MTDFVTLKKRQQQWWTSGDFGIIARTSTIVDRSGDTTVLAPSAYLEVVATKR